MIKKGGPGSGHRGHKGIKGHRGGSAPSKGHASKIRWETEPRGTATASLDTDKGMIEGRLLADVTWVGTKAYHGWKGKIHVSWIEPGTKGAVYEGKHYHDKKACKKAIESSMRAIASGETPKEMTVSPSGY